MTMIAQLRELVEGLGRLTEQHVRLAKLELAEDAKFIGVRVGVIAALAPFILVGYGFICVAIALALRRVMPADLAFLVVGLVNLLGGLAGIGVAARSLQQRPVLETSMTELTTTTGLVREELRR